MFGKIALFELRYQFRNPVFWVAAIIFFLLTFGAATSDDIQIGGGGNINANAPLAIIQTHLVLTLFFMFVSTAFVANVIVRDDDSGFGPMVRSTQVRKFDYLLGRFTGAFLAAAVAFATVPLAIWLGSLMPWVDSETIGPNHLSYYASAYFVFALPGMFMVSALFFAVATMTRSMMYTYIAVVVFLVLWTILIAAVQGRPDLQDTAALFEPFGLGALSNATRYWTASEANTLVPALEGGLLYNRIIWTGFALAMLVLAYLRFSFAEKGASKRKLRRQAKKAAKLSGVAAQTVDSLPALEPEKSAWIRLVTRTRFEVAQVVKHPAFFVLLLIGLFNTSGALFLGNQLYGTPARPLTFAVIPILQGGFTLIPIIIAIYYAGELVWRDRDRKMHEIIDSTSVPGWSYMVPKTIAVAVVLFAALAVSIISAMLIQSARGVTPEAAKYFSWYMLPLTIDMLILAILAVFVQALSPNKYVGWGIMVVYIVATTVLSNLGFEHPLYLYGSTGGNPISDLNGNAVGNALGWWLRLYWGAFALVLAVLAHLMWRRGTDTALMPRVKRVPARLKSPAGAVLAAGILAVVGSGSFLFNQMNRVEQYRTSDDNEAQLAAYEKKYLKYDGIIQPTVTDMSIDVELWPQETRMEASGRYAIFNDTDETIETLHVRLQDADVEVLDIQVAGATLESDDEEFKYRIYRFDEPLAPGATSELTFKTQRWQRGLRASGNDTRLVRNGTFLNSAEFAPQIGMNRSGLLQDRATRRKYDLPPELRPAPLGDEASRDQNYVGAEWVTADITVTTDAGQTPIAPGVRVSDTVENGRRTARFVSDTPILAFFSIQSADYEIAKRDSNGVELQVYYHTTHDTNVERMLDALGSSLDYYRANFGPYQFPHARIIEFPGYASFAQAFAGTMPYSESIGFVADYADEGDIDAVTYVVAHEVAHQYWAHQLISANQQGGTIMVETMAQYSAMMVMKEIYGEDQMRRFLKYELDNYLTSRGSEAIEELPLEKVENQGYIHYRKGAVVMYLLQDRLGETRVNAMLSELLDRYRFKGPPYAISTDLVDGFMSLARNDQERQLVEDLLRKITLYDLKVDEAETKELPDGSWETVMTVEATKFYADGQGKETESPLADQIEIGAFTARPGLGAFDSANVLSMERKAITSGKQEIRVVTDKEPTFVGIDPYNKYIDRNSDDNVFELG
ncbi:ABC transporter permease/M1 family aminopeptidase [Parerythrobacter jejuensis]|uniref:Aminopeptidase n=1 Tax=Parerythrobacter jejuensis TaxID=795812 RepID=A0A845ASD5_9SPHN|nr:M1 family aminopeptidase [Parerythrobacter jejuensis]MXP32083.1 aminopeptidase [Parerythrobacter jejuensis]